MTPITPAVPLTQPHVPEAEVLPNVPPTFDEAIAKVGNTGSTLKSAVSILLFEDYAEIELDKGIKKQISHASLKEMIGRSLNVQEAEVDIKGILLPSNVFFFSQSKDKILFNTYYPGGNREMIYLDKKMQIAAPNIVLAFTLRRDGDDWIVEKAMYFCTDLPINKLPKNFIDRLAPSKGIYLLPMSNTYDEGNMCYGGNTMPARFKDNNFRGLDWYYRFLWETPFNNDLGIRAVGSVGVGSWYGLLEKLAKAGKTFPYRDLRNWTQLDGAVASTSEIGNLRDR